MSKISFKFPRSQWVKSGFPFKIKATSPRNNELTHWGPVTHICVGKLTIIGSDNGLSPWRRQAIIWTNAGILLIRPLGTNFSEILIEIQTFSFKKKYLKMSSAKWRPLCLGLNVLIEVLVSTKHLMSQWVNSVSVEDKYLLTHWFHYNGEFCNSMS